MAVGRFLRSCSLFPSPLHPGPALDSSLESNLVWLTLCLHFSTINVLPTCATYSGKRHTYFLHFFFLGGYNLAFIEVLGIDQHCNFFYIPALFNAHILPPKVEVSYSFQGEVQELRVFPKSTKGRRRDRCPPSDLSVSETRQLWVTQAAATSLSQSSNLRVAEWPQGIYFYLEQFTDCSFCSRTHCFCFHGEAQ